MQHVFPATQPRPGEVLWQQPVRKQPIIPLIALALITLLVAAPSALSGEGGSSNPIVLMHSIADTTHTIATLLDDSNALLSEVDANTRPLKLLSANMASIGASAEGMQAKTDSLSSKLSGVGQSVSTSKSKLGTVDTKLTATATGIGSIKTSVDGSLGATKTVVGHFGHIEKGITAMDANLKTVIARMGVSTPLTKKFANNKTRIAIAGGNPEKFGLPNIVPGNRVMSVVLPMITTMQNGGTLVARKDSAVASNILVRTLLNRQVPDGTNVGAIVRPYDGFYGLPKSDYFIYRQVHGF